MTTIYGDKKNINGYSGYRENVSMWSMITNFLRNSGDICYGDSDELFYETADGKLYRLNGNNRKI